MQKNKKGEEFISLENMLTILKEIYLDDFKAFSCIYLSLINYLQVLNKLNEEEKLKTIKL